MGKKGIVLLCGLVLLLGMGGCQAGNNKTEQSSAASSSQSSEKAKTLEQGAWEDKLYSRLSKLIEDNGKGSAAYQADKKPYAVFDWDNTSVINDIGEATFTYQIENLAFKMTPEEFNQAVRTNLPADDFAGEYNNKDGQPVNIDRIAQDLLNDYAVLYDSYSGMNGNQPLEAVRKTNEYQDFAAKLRYLYEAIGDTFSSDISYPWVTYLYAGMTSEEVQALAEKSIDQALTDELTSETWESPADLKGQAGQVSVTFKRGVRSVKEMQNLYQTLMSQGIDVYICSASYIDVIIPYASNSKYGYNIPKDHITAMRLEKDSDGIIQPEYDSRYAQTQGEGKTETIKKLIAVNHGNQDPILIAGDSNGDYAMLKDFPQLQMGIIFNLLRDPSKGIGLLATQAIETYGREDELYYLQGRDENKGVLLKGRETIKLDGTEAQLTR
ncbi:haloacid dehalogenase-like hydrolase [Streptococcus panodentis]|uniref:phosphoserine phosphatase n=1 Tax=Streptococcus panodentis TaxID=1581472 RepID=A0ABS5AXN4_9STRE|nr:haloacid dehalogenase-like hydrolase [Streptococcus panodentis]MBP2621342.1 phosphoserine phosphatase [Streptococcus panodentis]